MGILNLVGGSETVNEYLPLKQRRTEPRIEPGQIWLVECETGLLSAFHAGLLGRANVVLYERALLAAVVEALPVGGYAEPMRTAGPVGAGSPGMAITPRALQFAAEGWSVLQLVERREGSRQRLRFAAEQLTCHDGKPPLLAIGTIVDSRYRERRGTSEDLAIVAAELDGDELLSLTFAASGVSPALRRPIQGQAFTANGLAG